jgi:hypothetical protein
MGADEPAQELGGSSREEILRFDAGALQLLPDLDIRANWKLVAELWLEALEVRPDAACSPGSTSLNALPVPLGSGWSASAYRRLAGSAAGEPWRRRFIAPNHLIERRPDGLGVLQLIPTGAAQCRVRRLNLGRADKVAEALEYLAGRLSPWCRRRTIAIAESAQQGLSEFGYRTAGGAPAPGVAWLRSYLSSRLPALAGERAPNESRQMHYNPPSA